MLTGPSDREFFNAANIIIGCYRGVPRAQEVLVVNNAESDYNRPLQPGDIMRVRLTEDPGSGTAVQLSDLTSGRSYTLKKSGRPAKPDAQLVGDWGTIDARTQAQVPPPAFEPTSFTSVSVDGRPLGSTSPVPYDMESSSRVLQIVTGGLSGAARDSFTCTRAGG